MAPPIRSFNLDSENSEWIDAAAIRGEYSELVNKALRAFREGQSKKLQVQVANVLVLVQCLMVCLGLLGGVS